MGLALAPVNNAALADSPADAHGVASSLVVVARMVGMVVGLALLTSIGLSRYFEAVRRLPNQLDTGALIGAGVVQVQTVFLGGAVAALLGAVAAFTLGVQRPRDRDGGGGRRRATLRRALTDGDPPSTEVAVDTKRGMRIPRMSVECKPDA